MNGPALRYEVPVSIHICNIVWTHGPWPAGVPDVTIFRAGLKERLEMANEFAIAEEGAAKTALSLTFSASGGATRSFAMATEGDK